MIKADKQYLVHMKAEYGIWPFKRSHKTACVIWAKQPGDASLLATMEFMLQLRRKGLGESDIQVLAIMPLGI